MVSMSMIYEILAVLAVFVLGMGLLTMKGNKIGWIIVIGAAIYAWLKLIKPLIS